MTSSRSYALRHAAYNSESRTFSGSRATCCVAMSMYSASAVISDCDGVRGQQSRCTLCKQSLRGTHIHPEQWKSELQQFLLRYLGAHVSAGPVSIASDGAGGIAWQIQRIIYSPLD